MAIGFHRGRNHRLYSHTLGAVLLVVTLCACSSHAAIGGQKTAGNTQTVNARTVDTQTVKGPRDRDLDAYAATSVVDKGPRGNAGEEARKSVQRLRENYEPVAARGVVVSHLSLLNENPGLADSPA